MTKGLSIDLLLCWLSSPIQELVSIITPIMPFLQPSDLPLFDYHTVDKDPELKLRQPMQKYSPPKSERAGHFLMCSFPHA